MEDNYFNSKMASISTDTPNGREFTLISLIVAKDSGGGKTVVSASLGSQSGIRSNMEKKSEPLYSSADMLIDIWNFWDGKKFIFTRP